MFTPRRQLAFAALFLASILAVRADTQLSLSTLGAARQSADASPANTAALAIDGNVGTVSQTTDVPNSYWEVEMGRKVRITQISVVASSGAANGLVVRVFDLRDQTVFQATITGVSGGGTWTTNLPAAVNGRIVHIGLENGQTNGAGNYQVELSEVQVFGDASPAFGPVTLGGAAAVSQSSTNIGLDPARAVDENTSTYTETSDLTDSFWLMTFDRSRPIQRIELINRPDAANELRMQGLTLRILDDASNSVAATSVSDPGAGNNFVYTPPPGTSGRYVKIGLEGGALNGQGNHIVSLAEVSVLTATNVMAGKYSYMTRDSDTMPPDSNGNDNNYSTVAGTAGLNTHDFYWEANLGQSYALYSVRIAAADGFQANLTHATLSIMDDNYNVVYSQHLAGASEVFDVPLPGPVFGHFVHVGIEYAERTGGLGAGANWQVSMKEVQAFGVGTNQVGLLSFTASPGDAVTFLNWQENDLYSLNLYPNIGSVGSNTDVNGFGTRTVSAFNTVEYVLVGSNYNGTFPRFVTVSINNQKLPVQISEFVAEDNFSLKDGNNNSADWIELHNPNNTTVDMTGYALSDNPATPTQWMFPAGVTIAPHGYLIVFADSANSSHDAGGKLHANFGLNKDGDSIILTASNGVALVDAITNFPAQMEDLAYGRTLDGQWRFLEPTPGAANIATAYDGWLTSLDFDHKRGWYTNGFSLTISNSNPGATVYWSTDGSEPTNVYTGPLLITNVTGVRASVARAGYKSPPTETHSYLFLNGIINSTNISSTYRGATYTNRLVQGFLDLPILCLTVPAPDSQWDFLGYNNDRPEREASFEIFMPDGSKIQEDCGMVHLGGQFGTGTGLYAKRTWQLDFRSKYGASKLSFPLFQGYGHGITPQNSFKELDVHAGNQDQGGYGSGRGFYMSHRFAEDTMLDMGDLQPHGRFVQLFVNGAYMGQFDIHERLTDAFLADYLGGEREDYQTIKGNDNTGTFGFIPGVPDSPDRFAWENVRSNRFSYAAIKDAVDMTNCIDFMLMWEWGNSEAEFRGAGARFVSPGDGRGFKVWLADADGHLRQQSGASGQLNKNSVTSSVFTNGPGYIFGALLAEANPDFKTLLADRIYKHCFNNGALTPAANLTRLNLRMAEITNSLVAECARWGASSTYDPVKWQTDAQYARDNIFPARTTTVFNQFRTAKWYPAIDPPVLSQFGGTVTNNYTLTVTAATGTIYYTLDGSDPRLPGGGISPSAIAFTPGSQVTTPLNVPASSTWRYFNTNAAPVASWTNIGFDDSTWRTGSTPMGYANDDKTNIIATTLSFGSDSANKWTGYYFRKAFVVTNLTGLTSLALALNRDDGAVVYLNGNEVKRDNMPPGTVVFSTFGSTNVSGPNETNLLQFSIPTNFLVVGTNVVSVEVHQASLTSSDIMFNLSLTGNATNLGSQLQLTLTNQTTFTARVWNGSTWSALSQSTFLLAPLRQPTVGDLVISEMNYHPIDLDNYEYVELYNASTNLLDLTNVRLSDGIDFTFPNNFRMAPGTFAVAARSIPDFAARYQTPSSAYYYSNIVVAGQYTGKLSDGGERIALLASNGVVLAEVTYSDGGAWPDRADGLGSSLELRDLSAAAATGTNLSAFLARGANWKSSSLYHGSPGRFDGVPKNIVINEVLAHTDLTIDWIEFRNLGADSIDLGGLYLSDHYDNLFRYLMPVGTVVPGNGYLGLSTTNFGFAFSELGSDILLLQASGTNIIRFLDTVNIPASQREESLGLYTLSTGETDFTELRANTEAAANALPRVGPVVMSEVMYKPAANQSEFVELVNISHTNVLLYDPLFPTNTWQLGGGVSFNLPMGQQLAPGAVAIICATNPATFRAQYGVSASIPVYGPWSGALNNAGDSVKLMWPGDPETNGFIPYYRVDHLRYEPAAPWPSEAAGVGGISLERATLEGYANDPANWQPSIPGGTPGVFVGNRPPSISADGFTTVMEGDTVSLTAHGSDLDQPWQNVSLSAQNLPPGSSFDSSTGAFSWTTGEADGPGVYNLKFVATDNGLVPLVRTQIVAVTVLESNLAPSLQAFTNLTYPAAIPLSINVSASDPDLPPQPLSFAATGLPAGLGIDPVSGRITGAAQAQGVFPVTVSVSDGQTSALFATNGFTLTITHSFISEATLVGNQPQFSFWSLGGESYDVSFSPQLSATNWQVIQSVSNAPGGLVTISNVPGGTNGFIRVLWKR
jgi:hypothetical protein